MLLILHHSNTYELLTSRTRAQFSKMSSIHGALIVFGSGPGVGVGVATLFAERGFEKIILLSRNATRLADDAGKVRSARTGISVYEIPADLADTKQVQESFKKVEECLDGTPLECVLFNAARLGKSEFFEFSPANLQSDLQVCVLVVRFCPRPSWW